MITDTELHRVGLGSAAVALLGPLIRAVLTAALVVVIAGQAIVCWGIAETTLHVRRMADFGVFYESARRARESAPPYAIARSADGRPVHPPNLTPPHVVAALMPLSLLRPFAALAVWAGASVLSAFLALVLIFRETRLRASARSLLLAMAAIVCAAPTGALLFSAQITWLIWAPATLSWIWARRGRWTLAAVMLGIVASVKPFVFLFALVLLLLGRRRAAGVVVLTGAGCYLAGLAVLGPDAFAGWIDALGSVSWSGHVWNGSALGFAARALQASPPSSWRLVPVVDVPRFVLPLWLALAAAILTIFLVAVRRRSEPLTPAGVDSVFAATLTTSFLLSPLAWVYYDFLLAAPFVALATTSHWRTRGRIAALVLAAVSFALTPGMLTIGQPHGLATVTIGSMYFWGLVALWAASVPGAGSRAAAA